MECHLGAQLAAGYAIPERHSVLGDFGETSSELRSMLFYNLTQFDSLDKPNRYRTGQLWGFAWNGCEQNVSTRQKNW